MRTPEQTRARIRAALPAIVEELAAELDYSIGYVRERLNEMGRMGEAHVCNARGEPGYPYGPRWAAGPAGPDAPPQPDFGKPRVQNRTKEPHKVDSKAITLGTIEKARANPASWLSAPG